MTTLIICLLVIVAIAVDLLDMTLAAMLGVALLLLLGRIDAGDVGIGLGNAGPTLALLGCSMILVRLLQPSGIFERAGHLLTVVVGGDGRRLSLGIIILVAPICALLPNATVVMLLAPAVLIAADDLEADPVLPIILLVVVSNTAGLLTLVGDPATFVVGSAIHMTFAAYLQRVSPGALLVLLAVLPIAAVTLPGLWHIRREQATRAPAAHAKPPPIKHPVFTACCLVVFLAQFLLFVVGESLAVPLSPPMVAFIGATAALLFLYGLKVEPISDVLRDLDYRTLAFFGLMFILVQGLAKSGVLYDLADLMLQRFGTDLPLVAAILMVAAAFFSSLIPNAPMVAMAVFVTKSYLVAGDLVPEQATGNTFADWPPETLPLFIAMMFGATLGGNATVIGASSNLVAAGICQRRGIKITFFRFMRYGVPITVLQLIVAAAFLFGIYPLMH